MSLHIGQQPSSQRKRGGKKKKEVNGLIVEQIICLQIKTYLAAKSYGQGGERMRH